MVIVGTTDLHGWFAGHERDKPSYGGLPLLASYINALRAANPNHVLVVDSGDLYQGTLESNLFEGEPVTRAYNAIGYTAAAVGNHEFDFGPVGPAVIPQGPADDPLGALKQNASRATFPFLSANMVEKATGNTPSWAKKSTMVTVDGARIGIIGLSTPDTPNVTMEANVLTLSFTDPVAAVKQEAAKLRADGADAVIVIAHMGGKCSDMNDVHDVASCCKGEEGTTLLENLPAGTIDAYFGGHTHQQMRQIVNGTPAVQANAYSHSFSTIDLWVDPAAHKVTKSDLRPHTMLCTQVFSGTETCDTRRLPKNTPQPPLVPRVFEGKTMQADANLVTLLEPFLERTRAKRNEPTGIRTAEKITRNYETESPLGDLMADAIKDGSFAEIGFINSGSIRNELPAGDLRYNDVFEVMPFDNLVMNVAMTGSEIIDALRSNAAGDRGLMQVSGIKYTLDRSRDPNDRITNVTLDNGKPLILDRQYRVAMPDFLAYGGDGLKPVLAKLPRDRFTTEAEGLTLRDVFIRVVKQMRQPISVKTSGRVTVVGKPAGPAAPGSPPC